MQLEDAADFLGHLRPRPACRVLQSCLQGIHHDLLDTDQRWKSGPWPVNEPVQT